jgi:ketosteroid isomerase-like protein
VRQLVENTAASAEDTLKALDAECTKAAVQANVEALILLESDDFTFTSPDGSVMTKAQDLETLKGGDLYYESITLDDVSVRAYKESGVVTGRATVKGWYKTFDISGSYRYTVTFARLDGKWKVVASQMTRVQS